MNTPEQASSEEASHHSSLDASSPKANSLVLHSAFEELLQRTMDRQTNASLDAVLQLNENQARRGTGSYIGSQQATSAHNSAIQSDAGASVISSIANSRVSSSVIPSVSQHRVRDWLTSTENITQGSLLTEASIDARNHRESAEVSKPAKKVKKHTQVESVNRGNKPCVTRVNAVTQSVSDGSTVCSRSIETQTEAEQNKSSKTDIQRETNKTEDNKVTAPVKKTVVKSGRERRRGDDDEDEDPSSSEPDDSDSESDSDMNLPPRKAKKAKVRPEREVSKHKRRATDIKAPTYSGDAYVDQFLKQFRTRARLTG